MTPATEFPPRQARSRATLNNLLAAAARVIDARGLDRATVATIAREARVAPTVVYRRFRDKDALLEAVFIHMMDAQENALGRLTGQQTLRGLGLAEFSRQTIRSTVLAYRRQGRFLTAARQFAASRGSKRFRTRLDRFETVGVRHAVALMLERRGEIGHPRPEEAVAVGLAAIIGAVRELTTSSAWLDVLPSDEAVATQLTDMYLRYLRTKL